VKTAVFLLALASTLSGFGERALTIGEYSAEVRSNVVARIREALEADGRQAEVVGTVTFVGKGFFFIQRDDDGMKVLLDSTRSRPVLGAVVRVAGRPSLEGGRVVFSATDVRSVGTSAQPMAIVATGADLTEPGSGGVDVNWRRTVVEGEAIGRTDGGFAMNVDDVPVNVICDRVPGFLEDCGLLHPRVRVTGIAELLLDQSALAGQGDYVLGVKLDVASSADIELLPDVAYQLRRRGRLVSLSLTLSIGVLIAVLLVFAVIAFRQRRRLFRSRTIMAERKRMADDIHDTIEQHLVGAGMLIELKRYKEAKDVLVRAKREIRDVVWGLKNDDMMRQSPADMLRQLAHDETTKGLYRVDTRLTGLPESLDASAMRDLSLIVREAIGNAVKHGGAKKIAISSDPLPDGGWLLRIANDGTPFDPAQAPGAGEGHFGLEGMGQRARRLGATIAFQRHKDGMVLAVERKS